MLTTAEQKVIQDIAYVIKETIRKLQERNIHLLFDLNSENEIIKIIYNIYIIETRR